MTSHTAAAVAEVVAELAEQEEETKAETTGWTLRKVRNRVHFVQESGRFQRRSDSWLRRTNDYHSRLCVRITSLHTVT